MRTHTERVFEVPVTPEQLWPLVQQLGFEDRLTPIKLWQQIPNPRALTSAQFPAAAITSPGLADRPDRRSFGYDTKWRVAVGIFDRGDNHDNTAWRTRTWAALVRGVMVRNPSVGGVASSLRWISEDYAERSERESARTLGGCAVGFDIGVTNVVDLSALDPAVRTTQSDLAVNPPQE